MTNLRALSNDELLSGLQSLLGSQRELLACLLRYLGEVEDRRLHLEQAFSSLFEFCTVKLRMSDGEAFRRITAARLARDFPVVFELIESGVIHLSGLVVLRDHLTAANHAELLRQASGKSKRAIEVLVAERFPKPDAASTLRKLPQREPQAPGEQPALTLETPAGRAAPVASQAAELRPKVAQPARASRVEPLSAARYKVQFTASEELKNKLERARRLLSHSNPSGDLAVIVERAVDLLLGELEKTKLGKTKRPRRPRARQPGTISRAARREVFERDGEQCSFVSAHGRRCEARAFIELDHVQARARGGSGESHNVRVLCRQHNKLWAEQTFGRTHIERQIHMRQRKCGAEAQLPSGAAPLPLASVQSVEALGQRRGRDDERRDDERRDDLLRGLTGLGFRPQETRAALEKLRSGKGPVPWHAPLEQVLRAATQMLTK
jgi:hypothetical protein